MKQVEESGLPGMIMHTNPPRFLLAHLFYFQ